MFKVIHQLVDSEEDILMVGHVIKIINWIYKLIQFITVILLDKVLLCFQVATDVIKEFAADGVKYLELRSTPREEKSTG